MGVTKNMQTDEALPFSLKNQGSIALMYEWFQTKSSDLYCIPLIIGFIPHVVLMIWYIGGLFKVSVHKQIQ